MKISIIVPVYNVEKYLNKCMDSIINQTLKDIEIICVDDGSTDDCPNILDEYAKKDNRIKVIHKVNEGYGKAINVGVKAATGEYIGIVESDDCILPKMFETLYCKAEENNLDLIKSSYYLYWENLDIKQYIWKSELEEYYDKVLTRDDYELLFRFSPVNWTGIYKRTFLEKNNIYHNETPGASYQDTGFLFQVMSFVSRAMWIKDAFYLYRQDNPAASIKSKSKMYALIDEYNFIENILRTHGKTKELELYYYHRMKGHKYTFNRIDDNLKKEYIHIIQKEYNAYKKQLELADNPYYNDIIVWLESICNDSENICNRIIAERNYINKKINEAKDIIIYGENFKTLILYAKIHEIGYGDKINYIAVSKNNDMISGNKPYKLINEIENVDGRLIIIAEKKESSIYNNLVNNLKENNLDNFIDSGLLIQ